VSRAAHPARSLDFLSRLHDGELTPSERAHFESHRSHCDECRRAAADFEATLDYYRTTGTTAPRADLAARILRRLEASSPRRRPFGVVFGIDLKWAGAFTAALIVTLLGYSLVDRERERKQIRVTFPAAPASPKLAEATPPAPTAPASREPASRADRKKPPEARKQSLLAKDEAAPAPGPTDHAGVPTDEMGAPPLYDAVSAAAPLETKTTPPSSNVAQAPVAAAKRTARPAAKATSAGGADGASADKTRRAHAEADLETASSAGVAPSAAPAIRLIVAELDGWGPAPRAVNASEIDLKPEDRGRYLVVIGANGIPIEIRREEPARERNAAASTEPPVLEVLRKLRFPAGDRPRRLLVTVE
jgi:hypothetical protein